MLEEYLARFPPLTAQIRLQFEMDKALQANGLLPPNASKLRPMPLSRACAAHSSIFSVARILRNVAATPSSEAELAAPNAGGADHDDVGAGRGPQDFADRLGPVEPLRPSLQR
jgi:hypothetical protein